MRILIGLRLTPALAIEWELTIRQRYLRQILDGTPTEQHFVRFDINLIEQTIHHPAVFGAANRLQIELGYIYRGYEDCPLLCDLTFVNVDVGWEGLGIKNGDEGLCFPGERDMVYLIVRCIQDTNRPKPKSGDIGTMPVSQHELTVQHLRLQSRCVDPGALPDELAIVRVDGRVAGGIG